MPLTVQLANDLSSGPAYLFADWPNIAVSTFGAGVYTIWHSDGRFMYVGMSGRGMTTETIRRNTPQGIYTRLQSHASGRRSGAQFCVYRQFPSRNTKQPNIPAFLLSHGSRTYEWSLG